MPRFLPHDSLEPVPEPTRWERVKYRARYRTRRMKARIGEFFADRRRELGMFWRGIYAFMLLVQLAFIDRITREELEQMRELAKLRRVRATTPLDSPITQESVEVALFVGISTTVLALPGLFGIGLLIVAVLVGQEITERIGVFLAILASLWAGLFFFVAWQGYRLLVFLGSPALPSPQAPLRRRPQRDDVSEEEARDWE